MKNMAVFAFLCLFLVTAFQVVELRRIKAPISRHSWLSQSEEPSYNDPRHLLNKPAVGEKKR